MNRDIAEQLLSIVSAQGYDEVEVFYEEKDKYTVQKRRNGTQLETGSTFNQGVGIKTRKDGDDKYRYIPGSPEGVLESLKSDNLFAFTQLSHSSSSDEIKDHSTEKFLKEMKQLYTTFSEENQAVFQGIALPNLYSGLSLESWDQRMTVASTKGVFATDHRTCVTMESWAGWTDKAWPVMIRRSIGGQGISQIREEGGSKALAVDLAESAQAMAGAVEVESGEWSIILGPGNPAILIHEACGHGLEGDLVKHTDAVYRGRLGKQVASEQVTLMDDPLYPGATGSYQVDDEGEKAQSTVLIAQGKLEDYLHDQATAPYWGKKPNGHGRRVSYQYPAIPRMSNTFITNGEYSPDEIIAQTEKAIYVKSLGFAETDMTTGRFKVRISEGFLIENGKITKPIQSAWLYGSGPEVLASIDRVGNDFALFQSHRVTCNKINQLNLPVSVGSPTLRVRKIKVVGGE